MQTNRSPQRRSSPVLAKPAHLLPLELETFLPYQLAVTATAVSQGLARVYGEQFGLTIADWRVLANLGRFGPMNAGDIAAHSTLDKPKVTRTLRALKARRLISRTTATRDRRQIRIALTAEGTAMFVTIAKRARHWEAQLLAPLSASERTEFDKILAKVLSRARALNPL
jgi:DNA-binding MarR family transcriptional regulator